MRHPNVIIGMAAALIMLSVHNDAKAAGPYLEFGLGDFVMQNWPDSPDCECGPYLGNEGHLGYLEAGIESPKYPIFWQMKATVTGKLLHISNTGTGRDTGIHGAFVTVRISR